MGTKPILVCMVWRGGDRFARCMRSIENTWGFFARVIVSVTGEHDSADMLMAMRARQSVPNLEVICTGTELPTMQHQAFWIEYLVRTGAGEDEWVCWLAYDDELRSKGLQAITNPDGTWNLDSGTAYFGPWAMRGESPDELWNGDPDEPTESWTCFPAEGPTRLTVSQWIGDQLRQPTYMQMSGSVNQLRAFVDLKIARPQKQGPMRIEMAVAASPSTTMVEEFRQPIAYIYGRADSDRANYGKVARREDLHLLARLARYAHQHPASVPPLVTSVATAGLRSALSRLGVLSLPKEEWRTRGDVS